MHFDGNVIMGIVLGNVPTLLVVATFLSRMDRRLQRHLVEHEMLIGDYCERKGIKPMDLPTRARI